MHNACVAKLDGHTAFLHYTLQGLRGEIAYDHFHQILWARLGAAEFVPMRVDIRFFLLTLFVGFASVWQRHFHTCEF